MDTGMPTDKFWANEEDPHQLANYMDQFITYFRNYCSSRGLIGIWKKKLQNYYGRTEAGMTSHGVTEGGTQGELALIQVNDFRQLIQDQLVTVTSQRPTGIAKANNSDPANLKAAKIGEAVAEYYMIDSDLETKFVNTAEIALVGDEGFVDLFWDKTLGDVIAKDGDENITSGDVRMRVHCTWNVARDMNANVDQQFVKILSYKENKWKMAATYPKFKDEILAAKEDDLPNIPMNELDEHTDMIWVHLLVVDRNPAVPKGRYALKIGNEIVFDLKLPFPMYPIERMAPSDVIDGMTGYSASNDLLSAQETTDVLHSVATTNLSNFGATNIVGPEGVSMNYVELAKGLRYFTLPAGLVDQLRPLYLAAVSPDIFNYINLLDQKKQKAVGSVSSVLAQQAAQGASGSSMALIQTQAISYNSGIQRSYYALLSKTMTKLIMILRQYADTPRIARIVGRTKSAGLKEFKWTGDDLEPISSITYELTNPMSQTFGGRTQMAQDLIKNNMISSPKQYITFITTGQLETLIEGDEAAQMTILEENEALRDGRPVKAVITENHAQHITGHNWILTPDVKANDVNLTQSTLAHIQEHVNLWMEASMSNPAILIATNQQPLPIPQQGPQANGAAPGPGAPPPGIPQPPNPGREPSARMPKLMGGAGHPQEIKAQEVKNPNLPSLPGTRLKPVVPGVGPQ